LARIVLHKHLMVAAAAAVGLDLPRSYGPAVRVALDRQDLAYPVVVRPDAAQPFAAHFGAKVLVAQNRAELERVLTQLETAGFPAQIYDLVPGPDSVFFNYSVYLDRNGHPVAEMPMHKLRKSPPFYGISRVIETHVAPEVAQQLRDRTLALLRHIGWQGMASAEYKLDPRDGRLRLIEVNGRCFATAALALRAGVNYALLAWQEAAHGAPRPASPNGWQGVLIDLRLDLLNAALFHRQERLSWREYLAPYARPRTLAVWSASDPKPYFVDWSHTLREAARWVRDPGQRAALRRRVLLAPQPLLEP
jgi:predicted ATP-grasp superfamily ATP-dependent carboligase